MLRCHQCPGNPCSHLEGTGLGSACPSTFEDIQNDAWECVEQSDKDLMVNSHLATNRGYGTATRVEETMIFARVSGYTKIGVAFCITLAEEARIFSEILQDNGFEVASILCKNGALPRDLLGEDVACIKPGQSKALCNPIAQAKALNAEHTQLNVMLGLCVGHDSLFSKYSQAPATTLVVKDRVTGNNPVIVLNEHDGSFKDIHHVFED